MNIDITAKQQLAQKFGFGEDFKAYLIYGDNTYAIKEHLKSLGAKFNPILKWFLPHPVELPEGYSFCEINFDDIYEYHPESNWAIYKEDAENTVRRKILELKGPSTSEWYPAPEKTRLRNLTVKVEKIFGFSGYYGYTNVYTFTSGNYIFVWMTSKNDLDLTIGETVDLTGTIKKFDEYMGEKQTHLSRCIIKQIEE